MAGFNTENSAVNTALLSSIFDLTNAQKVLAGAVFGFTDKLNIVNTEDYKGIDDDTKESIKLLNDSAKSITTKLAEIEKAGKKNQKSDSTTMRSMATVAEVFGEDEEKSKRFRLTIKALDAFVNKTARNAEGPTKLFDSLANLSEKFSGIDFVGVGKGLSMIAVGITAIGSSMYLLTHLVTPAGFLMAMGILTSTVVFAKSITQLNTNQLDMASASMARIGASIALTAGAIALISILPPQSVAFAITTFLGLAGAIALSAVILNKGNVRRRATRTGVAEGPAIIAASLGILAVSIWAFNALVPKPEDALIPILVITGFAIAMGLINRIGGKGGLEKSAKGLILAVGAVALLAMAIMVWKPITIQDAALPMLAIVGLSLALGLMNKLSGRGDIKNSAIGLIIASAAVAVLAWSIKLWDDYGIDAEMIALPALAIVGLMTGLTLMAKFGQAQVLLAAGSLIMAAVAVGLLAYTVKMWDDVSEDSMTKAGIFLTGIGAGLALLGQLGPQALMAAGAMVITGFAIKLIGEGLQLMGKLSGEQMLEAGLFITGMGAVLALLGLAPWAIVGALALGAGGLALIKVGQGMQEMSKADLSKTGAMVNAIRDLAGLFFEVGGPIDTPMILSGAASVMAIGSASLRVANTLKVLSDTKLTDTQIKGFAGSIGTFINSMIQVFNDFKGDYDKVEDGINALMGLGNMISGLANGLVMMGNLQFVEMGIVNGELKPVNVRQFGKADFDRVASGIETVITALTDPLAKVGSTANMFSSGDVGRGIKSLTGLGTLVKTIAEGVAGVAQLQFTEYEVVDGRLVPVHTRKFTETDFKNVGSNIESIITALSDPLAKIGKGSSWFKRSDVEKGIDALQDLAKNVMTPVSKMVEFIKSSNLDGGSALEFSKAFNIVVAGIGAAMGRIGKTEYTDANQNMAKFVDNVKDLTRENDGLSITRSNFERTARALVNINGELSNDKLKRIVELKETIQELGSTKLIDNFNLLILMLEQRLHPLFMQMNDSLRQIGYNSMQGIGMNPDYNGPMNTFAQSAGVDTTLLNPQNDSQYQGVTPEDFNKLIEVMENGNANLIQQLKRR